MIPGKKIPVLKEVYLNLLIVSLDVMKSFLKGGEYLFYAVFMCSYIHVDVIEAPS